MLSLFFQFKANLNQSGGQMPDAQSIILSFSIDRLKKEVFWHYKVYFVKLTGVYQALWPLFNGKKTQPWIELLYSVLKKAFEIKETNSLGANQKKCYKQPI